ncbi:hypothetical protein [Streptomyces fructofermentans]|uniref:hypothetical protein n=1 Tax=Streptomyces fructofermentans TaxID=152141 RepID=UPI0033F359DA
MARGTRRIHSSRRVRLDLLECDPRAVGAWPWTAKPPTAHPRTLARPHLLSAALDGGRTVSQLRVPDKTTEVTGFTKLLSPFDLAGVVVTADALHTHRDHVRWLVEAKRAHYLLMVKRTSRRCTTLCDRCRGRR